MLHVAILINEPNKSLLSAIVQIFTRSVASHVELVFSDGLATIVTPKCMALVQRPNTYDLYHWVMIPLPDISAFQESLIRSRARTILYNKPKYDYLGAIAGFFGSSRQNKNKWYCGELVAELLGEYIPELKELKWATPEKVWRILTKN